MKSQYTSPVQHTRLESMPQRLLKHGCAPSCTGAVLQPGSFARDVHIRGQFLIDLEFLSRYTLSQFTCVYVRDAPYVDGLAGLFPWVHFQVYGCEPVCEYDPEQPDCWSGVTAEARGNVTRWHHGFSRAQAGACGARPRAQSLVLICHGLDAAYQLLLHVQTRAQASLLDLVEPPDDYAEGELLLPMYVAPDRFMLFLAATMRSGARQYYPDLLREELGGSCIFRVVFG